MKWHWRKSDFEIGSCEVMRKRTQATVMRVSWKLEAGAPLTPQASRHRAEPCANRDNLFGSPSTTSWKRSFDLASGILKYRRIDLDRQAAKELGGIRRSW